jgi:hypothetical protein
MIRRKLSTWGSQHTSRVRRQVVRATIPRSRQRSVAIPITVFGSARTALSSSTTTPHVFLTYSLRAWKTVAEDRARNSVGKTASERTESESQRKVRGILPWIGKSIKLSQMNTGRAVVLGGPVRGSSYVDVLDCTEFFVKIGNAGQDGWSRSIPLTNIEISFDGARNCLELQERYN